MEKSALKARALRASEVIRRHGITQAEIAALVGASQGQVSRLLRGRMSRPSTLFEEVCLYAERLEGGVTADAVRANDDLVQALAETWDGTAEHAKCLAIVIRSLAVMRQDRRALGTSEKSKRKATVHGT